ncbi:glycosyltransferase family 2 protein [Flavobacterium sp.]|uniref:glycosyltransferase family 2 protein n=1 Tax=Flavobacterium sp. TaxID=239 RepID=UPI003D138EF6
MNIKFSIVVTTRNRLSDLKITLDKLHTILDLPQVECLIYDDASEDETVLFVQNNYPNIKLFQNKKSLGLIHNRNVLLNNSLGKYAISLDDDAHFLSENVLETIEKHFENNQKCGVIACRIFWGKEEPTKTKTNHEVERVQGFVGCGHIWNLKAWKEIPNYPEWFVFYGEEDFASYQLFKKGWEVHYVPEILVQHRVEIKERKKHEDYFVRFRRSFRSGWYLYIMFYPLTLIPKRMLYTLWVQIKTKVLRGDLVAFKGLILAQLDVLINLPKLLRESNRLTHQEFKEYNNLTPTKIYWQPENE